MEDIKPNVELKSTQEQPVPTEGPVILNDYDLTKPHETENADSVEGPTNEDEDIGDSPEKQESINRDIPLTLLVLSVSTHS